ncbi:hypothetical protein PV356_32860 [Streptomyces sp. WI03-5b]|uniref:hypothetical protein n=1 Tax=Streptomyces sp. WI03-5b TaxID=462946 RepID=UPI0029A857C6|nr:hypothetical protein [Streptomyces sp. WI03-5b]MDX2624235.1 hypothetical protein [Streptomyces sp. WI03-5b]
MLTSDLFTYPLKDPFSDSELVSLGSYLRQLLGQPFFEFIQFRASRGDPFPQLGIHARIANGRLNPASRNQRDVRLRQMI